MKDEGRTKERKVGIIEMKDQRENRPTNGPPFDICERTFQLALRTIKLSLDLEAKPGTHQVLSKQLLRSATSIGENVEEGQAAQSRADFISKYSIARKEARETNYWLRLIEESGLCFHPEIPTLVSETQQLTKILTTIIKNARGL